MAEAHNIELGQLAEQVARLAVEIQQVAAPPFGEAARAAWVHNRFAAEGLGQVEEDELHNVYACLPGAGSARPVVVSAHLDTVFPVETDLSVQYKTGWIGGPGIGDNSTGVAALFGLLRWLRNRPQLPGDIWLVANVGEEGSGDLRGMKKVVDRFAGRPLAYVILEGLAFGNIYHRALSVARYRIRACVKGGHSWVDYGQPSAIHELARLIVALHELKLPHAPRTTLNVGVVDGGISVNTIAPEAWLELDMRSEDERILDRLVEQALGLVRSANRSGSRPVTVEAEQIGRRPGGAIPITHPLVQLAIECLEAEGMTASTGIGSTDANVPLSRGFPAVTIGLTRGGGAHTAGEHIYTAPLPNGLRQMFSLVQGIFETLV